MAEFLHPHVQTRITDNTQFYILASGNTSIFAPFRSSIGPDNRVITLNNVNEAIYNFGKPEMGKYGQAYYNVLQWLESGGTVHAIRLMPDDALFNHLVLTVETKLEVDGSGVETRSVRTRADKYNGTSTLTINNIASARAILDTTYTTADGYTAHPISIFIPAGRGTEYKLGIRLTPLTNLDHTYDFRTYNLYITGYDLYGNDSVIEGPFVVSLDPYAKSRGFESMYYVDVINRYSQYLTVYDNKSFFDNIYDFLKLSIADVDLRNATNPVRFDIAFGLDAINQSQAIHGNILWTDTLSSNNDRLDVVHRITGGSDGIVDPIIEEQLYNNAFAGLIDSSILDKKQYEVDLVIDANFSDNIKFSINSFVNNFRDDCFAILDTGTQPNISSVLNYRRNILNMSNFRTAIFTQDAIVTDKYNGGDIRVTSPYFLCKKIPSVDNTFNMGTTFVGPRRGIIEEFKNISFTPNEYEKESLYKEQVNYIEKDPKKHNFSNQQTTQKINSALSDINNVRVLFRIKRDIEKILDDFRSEKNNSDTYTAMGYATNTYLQTWKINGSCENATSSIYASEYDKLQRIVRCKVELIFVGLIERIFIDISVNR